MDLNDEEYNCTIAEILQRLEILRQDVLDISVDRLLDAALLHEASQLNQDDDF